MAMRSSTSPRRIYVRSGKNLVCYGGVFFGPGNKPSEVNADKEVKIEVLENSHGKKRIQVTQKVGKKPAIVETWSEQTLTKTERGASAEA